MTERSLAYCGLDCTKCRAYLATREGDQASAAEIAALWSNPEEGDYATDDIWCDGCHSIRLHAFCANCPVRTCASDRGLGNCSACVDYACDRLETLWRSWVEASPKEAKANLDRIRSGAGEEYP